MVSFGYGSIDINLLSILSFSLFNNFALAETNVEYPEPISIICLGL
jgi:hypothetical protein